MIKSRMLKNEIAYRLRIDKGLAVVTEFDNGLGFCDVFGVSANGDTVEVEVKCDKQDLRKEVVSIDVRAFGGSKPSKHNAYRSKFLGVASYSPTAYIAIPNRYYFAVPQELAGYAEQLIRDAEIPYGLMVIGQYYPNPKNPWYLNTPIPAQKLHNDKITPKNMFKIMKRVSMETIINVRKLYEPENLQV